jgi:uncharacterized protein YukE
MSYPGNWWHPGHGCHDAIQTELAAIQAQLTSIQQNQETTMSALTDLQSADAALKAEVGTFLADIAAALQAEDPDIETVVSDINAQVQALQAADPANQAPPAPAGP